MKFLLFECSLILTTVEQTSKKKSPKLLKLSHDLYRRKIILIITPLSFEFQPQALREFHFPVIRLQLGCFYSDILHGIKKHFCFYGYSFHSQSLLRDADFPWYYNLETERCLDFYVIPFMILFFYCRRLDKHLLLFEDFWLWSWKIENEHQRSFCNWNFTSQGHNHFRYRFNTE